MSFYFHPLWFLQLELNVFPVPELFVSFAAILCEISNGTIKAGYRIGQLGLKILNQSSSDSLLPIVHVLYYAIVGILFEPLQSVIEMHRKAYEIGLHLGSQKYAMMHKICAVAREFHAGTNLADINDEIECALKSEECHHTFTVRTQLHSHHKAVQCLIKGYGENSDVKLGDLSLLDNDPSTVVIQMAVLIFSGHFERVKYLGKKCEDTSSVGKWSFPAFRRWYLYFYWGLASLVIARRKASKLSDIDRLITVLENATVCSNWNFGNKATLLNALRHSLNSKNVEAEGKPWSEELLVTYEFDERCEIFPTDILLCSSYRRCFL